MTYVTNAPRGMDLMNFASGREWVLEFNLEAFDISLYWLCILGQHYGDYLEGLREIFADIAEDPGNEEELESLAESCGFATSMNILSNRLLQREWEQLITDQLAELGVPRSWRDMLGCGRKGREMHEKKMTPGEALLVVNAAIPEELRGENVDEAMDVLYNLAESALNESEAL